MSDHAANEEVPMGVWLSSDSELGLVHADMRAWEDAHPCECEALCTCAAEDANS